MITDGTRLAAISMVFNVSTTSGSKPSTSSSLVRKSGLFPANSLCSQLILQHWTIDECTHSLEEKKRRSHQCLVASSHCA